MQCGILEEQARDALESEREEECPGSSKQSGGTTVNRTKITDHQQTIRLNLITMN